MDLQLSSAYSSNCAYNFPTSSFVCRRKSAKVNLFGFRKPQLLQPKAVACCGKSHARLHFHEIVAVDVLHRGVKLVPHPRLDRAAAVAQLQPQIRFALARIANLFFVDEEKRSDVLSVRDR